MSRNQRRRCGTTDFRLGGKRKDRLGGAVDKSTNSCQGYHATGLEEASVTPPSMSFGVKLNVDRVCERSLYRMKTKKKKMRIVMKISTQVHLYFGV